MSMEIFQKVREMGQRIKHQRRHETIDYDLMTAPCGLPCFECYLYLARFDEEMAATIAGVLQVSSEAIQCRGCRAENGNPVHIPMACRVYQCIESTEMHTCAECNDFPCDYLHPYRDQAEKWHNTKVYNLCRIKKLGLETWAREEAGTILDRYFYGAWTL